MKPILWVGNSLESLKGFPRNARRDIGFALDYAQKGDKHPSAKPLHGFGGAGVLEIVEASEGNAYRVVYLARFPEAIYVLHAFMKKSKQGIKTPKPEIDLIKERLRIAENDHRKRAQR